MFYDIEYYGKACDEFEQELYNKKSSKGPKKISLKHIKNKFMETQKISEEKIFEIINEKIDMFVELSGYEWLPSKVATEPSPYVQGKAY